MTSSRFRVGFAALAGVLLLVPVGLAACSSDDSTPASAADAAAPIAETGTPAETGAVDGGGGTDTSTPPDSGGACESVINGAAVVGETAAAGARPVAAGGALVDGTYYMTKHEVYSPGTPDANTRKRTWRFAGGSFQVHNNDTGSPEVALAGTYTLSGTTLTLTGTCPAAVPPVVATLEYTATPTSFTEHASSGEDLFIFTKQ